MKNVSKRLLSN